MALATPAYRWRLVPVLTCAGFVSGVYTSIIIRRMAYDTANEYPFTFFGSLSFGLTLCAVLWAFGFVRSRKAVATLVAATIAVHLIDVFLVESRAIVPLIFEVTLPIVGKVFLWSLVEHLFVALAVYSAFLLVLVPGRGKLWTLLVAPVCAVLTVVLVFFIVRVADSLVVNDAILGFPAQAIQACFLAAALAIAGTETTTPQKRFALVYVQLGYFVAVFAGTHVLVDLPRQAVLVRNREEITLRLASAPPRANLPALNQDLIDRVFLMNGVGEWQPYGSSTSRMPAEQAGGDTFAPRPERISYYARYSRTTAKPDDFTMVTVNVTQYPNAEWARFDVLNSTGQVGLPRLSQFGHNFYQDGPYFSWSSGDRRILLDCQGTPRDVIDEFLKAYLAKYPSDL